MSEKKQINLEVDIQVVAVVDGAAVPEETRRATKPGPRAEFREAGGACRRQWRLSKGGRR